MRSKESKRNTVVIRFILISIFSLALYMQSAAQNDSLRQYYLEKSKSQKSGAWVLVGGGLTIGVIGAIVAASSAMSFGTPSSAKGDFSLERSVFRNGSVVLRK